MELLFNKLSENKLRKHALCICISLIAVLTIRAQEFILPSSSFDVGISAGVTSFTIREASHLKNFGFTPGLSIAYHTNLNKQFTHSFYGMGDVTFASNKLGNHTNGLGYEFGYKVAMLKSPFGLITGLGFKNQLYYPQEIGLSELFWLSQIYIPAEVYWTKLLPSKDAVLVQLSTPIIELVSATDLPEPPKDNNWIGVFGDVETANRDYSINLPILDYSGLRFAAAYVNPLSRTSALKIAYVFQYYKLRSPENVNMENGLTLQLQF